MEFLGDRCAAGASSPFKNNFSKTWSDASTASLFIPRGPVDILRDCWRRVVFRVDCRSAPAVSAIMLEKLSEKEILALIEDFNTAAATIEGLNVRYFWSTEHSELLSRASPEFARLHQAVEKYRHLHADQLYRLKMVDVDICFEHATLGMYEAELKAMQERNVKIYHYWPERKERGVPIWPQRLRISAIGKKSTIDELYLKRQADGEVEINANTHPAPLSTQTSRDLRMSPRLRTGKIFPCDIPDRSKLPVATRSPAVRQTIRKRIDEICSREQKHSTELVYQPLLPGLSDPRPQGLPGSEQTPTEPRWKRDQLLAAKAALTVNCERMAAHRSHISFLRRHEVFSANPEADECTLEGLTAELDRLVDETEDMRLKVVDREQKIFGTRWPPSGNLVFDFDMQTPNLVPDEEECFPKIHRNHSRPR